MHRLLSLQEHSAKARQINNTKKKHDKKKKKCQKDGDKNQINIE